MLPFRVTLRGGHSPFREIVYAATRAVVSGELVAGDRFPSVRELSAELRINPNTAQKVIAELTRTGMLEVRPGIGTVVTAGWRGTAGERRQLLANDVERLVVAAKRFGLSRDDVTDAVVEHWETLFGSDDGEHN